MLEKNTFFSWRCPSILPNEPRIQVSHIYPISNFEVWTTTSFVLLKPDCPSRVRLNYRSEQDTLSLVYQKWRIFFSFFLVLFPFAVEQKMVLSVYKGREQKRHHLVRRDLLSGDHSMTNWWIHGLQADPRAPCFHFSLSLISLLTMIDDDRT